MFHEQRTGSDTDFVCRASHICNNTMETMIEYARDECDRVFTDDRGACTILPESSRLRTCGNTCTRLHNLSETYCPGALSLPPPPPLMRVAQQGTKCHHFRRSSRRQAAAAN